MRRLVIVGLLAGVVHSARVEEAHAYDLLRARDALDRLVRELCGDRTPAAPSLTMRVAEFVDCGDEAVRHVLEEFWERSEEPGSLAQTSKWQVEGAVRLIYGLEPSQEWFAPRLRTFGGAVLRSGPDSPLGPTERPPLPPLKDLIAGRELQPAPAPDLGVLLDADRSDARPSLSPGESEDACAALGEAAAASPKAVTELVEEFRSGRRGLALALARAGTPPARAALVEVLAEAAAGIASEGLPKRDGDRLNRLWALRRLGAMASAAAPDEVRAAIAGMEGETRTVMLSLAGMRIAVPILLAEFDAAESKEARRAAFRSIRELIHARVDLECPRVADVPRLLDVFLTVAPELPEAERPDLWWAAERLFYPRNREPISWSPDSIQVKFNDAQGSIGPYPDMETVARRMREDLAAGTLVFLDPGEEPGVFAPPLVRLGIGRQRAHSDFPPAEDRTSRAPKDFPVFTSAKWVEEGLEIALTNRGSEPFLVNPRITRYTLAEVVGPRRGPWRRRGLHLDLGFIGTTTATPAESLVEVNPGEAFRWIQQVRPEHRNVGFVGISIKWADYVLGAAAHPVLTAVAPTRVR